MKSAPFVSFFVLALALAIASCKDSPQPRGAAAGASPGGGDNSLDGEGADGTTTGDEGGDLDGAGGLDGTTPGGGGGDLDGAGGLDGTTPGGGGDGDATDGTTPGDGGDGDANNTTTTTTTTEPPKPCANPTAPEAAVVLTAAERESVLKGHNDARTAVKVGKLAWSDDLAGYAKDWAEHLSKDVKDGGLSCSPQHRPSDDSKWKRIYGESIFSGFVTNPAEAAVANWNSQKGDYKEGDAIKKRGEGDPITGNYTQMVWDKTTSVGCAKVRCSYRCGAMLSVLVCNYDPVGNVIGQVPYKK